MQDSFYDATLANETGDQISLRFAKSMIDEPRDNPIEHEEKIKALASVLDSGKLTPWEISNIASVLEFYGDEGSRVDDDEGTALVQAIQHVEGKLRGFETYQEALNLWRCKRDETFARQDLRWKANDAQHRLEQDRRNLEFRLHNLR